MKVNGILDSRVLLILTNDDGIEAPGLQALELACGALGQLTTVAPDRCHSYGSHRVTTSLPITLTELVPGRFHADGTPADCARIALTCLAPEADWLISGINRGGNLGVDIYLSGTVAAAREAALLGARAIAISQSIAPQRELDWDLTCRRARRAIERVFAEPYTPRTFWNINLPHPAHDRTDCPIVFCPVDPSPLDVRFAQTGRQYQYCGTYQSRLRIPDADVAECFAGNITISQVAT